MECIEKPVEKIDVSKEAGYTPWSYLLSKPSPPPRLQAGRPREKPVGIHDKDEQNKDKLQKNFDKLQKDFDKLQKNFDKLQTNFVFRNKLMISAKELVRMDNKKLGLNHMLFG
ncbi:uncharacterized protein LOC118679663 isoform X4 [Myotis myotis]|uniref:uncharacterized protein LOC118679663 isoform X4 n=1 Tax=Myotis myotis TaxID=51298 RepID=UPI00174D3606|nr:uncharacterized protein LOC118679663 isoform X4 [Myotis myotis]